MCCRSLLEMCTTVQQGLTILNSVWRAHSAQSSSHPLYQSREWEDIRGKLLSSLKTMHLVCTAGLVTGSKESAPGLAALQQACDMADVRSRVILLARIHWLARLENGYFHYPEKTFRGQSIQNVYYFFMLKTEALKKVCLKM